MADSIPASLREAVAARARHRCEYCLIAASDSFDPHHVDHIVSKKHGGASTFDNLALCCCRCNWWKGSDVAGCSVASRALVRLYNPRIDKWRDHFSLDDGEIVPLTEIAEVTVRLLKINARRRLEERRRLMLAGRYPPAT